MEIIRNVLVDSFTIKRLGSLYFLTHWHADHYAGITSQWPYGSIYCSQITRRILLVKYPKLDSIVVGLSLNEFHSIPYAEQQTLRVKLIDSNHMAGSVMFLFEHSEQRGKKYYLHTGDMRFNAKVLQKQTNLFFPVDQKNFECKYDIETLFLDNTYCDPIFQFPNRSDALKLTKQIIDKQHSSCLDVHVCLVTDSIGKQEAFVALSLHYRTKVILSEERYQYCEAIWNNKDVLSKFFVKRGEQNKQWIEVIKRSEKERIGEKRRVTFIGLTGWANLQDYHKISQNQYVIVSIEQIVPYSLHSNYQELQLFISAVKPKNIVPIVQHHEQRKSSNFRNVVHTFSSYFNSLMHMKQRGLKFFRQEYATQTTELNKSENQKQAYLD